MKETSEKTLEKEELKSFWDKLKLFFFGELLSEAFIQTLNIIETNRLFSGERRIEVAVYKKYNPRTGEIKEIYARHEGQKVFFNVDVWNVQKRLMIESY